MTTGQAYAVEGQPKIVQVTRVDGYILDDIHAFKAIWDKEAEAFQMSTNISGYGVAEDVYKAIEWASSHGIERIELTGKFQI